MLLLIGIISIINLSGMDEWNYKHRNTLFKPSKDTKKSTVFSGYLLIMVGILFCIFQVI